MGKVIVYIRHDRHTDDFIKVFTFTEENEEKVKQLCQDDWGVSAHEVGYQGDYGFGHGDDYFSYYKVLEVSQI